MKWNEKCNIADEICCDIPIGRLCCYKPLGEDRVYFGHMAGMVVDDFTDMSFLYVLQGDKKYYFSREVIIAPYGVYSEEDARKYFDERDGGNNG